MQFMQITVLLFLVCKPVYYSPQKPDILECEEIVRLGDKYGMKAVEGLINPLTLLYLDTTYAGHIVNWEFRKGFLKGHPDSAGYYILELPEYTIDIVSDMNNIHAASLLLSYYCSVPKVLKSDTIYRLYDQLYRLLPLLVGRKPSGPLLESKLRNDFKYWARISSLTPPVKYTDPSVEFDRFLNFKPVNKQTDPRFMELILSLALQQMGSPGFGEKKINELRKMQTCLNNTRFQLPVLFKENNIFTEAIETQTIPALKHYGNINQLLHDKAAMTLLISTWLTRHNFSPHMPYSLSKFLVKSPGKAYFEIYYDFGMQAIRMTLQGDRTILMEKIMEAID